MAKSQVGKSVRVCRKCRGIIHENSIYDYCSDCIKKVEETFDKIRNYLRDYPGATVFEMEQRLGISSHVINNFVRDGRLIEIPNEYLNIECLRCGCLLLSAHHKYCPTCETEIQREIEIAKQSLMPFDKNENLIGKMRFRDYGKKQQS